MAIQAAVTVLRNKNLTGMVRPTSCCVRTSVASLGASHDLDIGRSVMRLLVAEGFAMTRPSAMHAFKSLKPCFQTACFQRACLRVRRGNFSDTQAATQNGIIRSEGLAIDFDTALRACRCIHVACSPGIALQQEDERDGHGIGLRAS
jgi:hypothetical protein